MLFLKTGVLTAFLLATTLYLNAQQPATEFTKGALLLIKLNNGFTTSFSSRSPDLYTGGVSLNPQITIVPNTLRLGASAGLAYNDKKASGLFGPMAAIKLATIETKNYGSLANIHLIAEANWGTHQQKMAGGGIGIELLQKIQLGITAQRDYHLNNWWLQSFIGYQFNKRKKTIPEF